MEAGDKVESYCRYPLTELIECIFDMVKGLPERCLTDVHPFQHESLTPQIFSLSRMTLDACSLYRAVGGYGVKLGWITGQKELCYGATLGLEPKAIYFFAAGNKIVGLA